MFDGLWIYFLLFSRLALGLMFTASVSLKLRNLPAFETAIENFKILPRQFTKPSAYLFLVGEASVVVLMIVDGTLLPTAFLSAIFLLSLFTIALLLVLWKGIQTSCACFGSSQRPVSSADVWRNIGFLVCACIGLLSFNSLSNTTIKIGLGEAGLLGMMAVVFVILSVYLRDVIELFRFL
ncbi:MAG: hypothetical protein HS124_00845 [Anaerolineales bacterium]|nr:hypothetical protein [Anaerolineales bacterium]